jgi:hypothetical protein
MSSMQQIQAVLELSNEWLAVRLQLHDPTSNVRFPVVTFDDLLKHEQFK